MSLPYYLADLPPLSDVISGIEKAVHSKRHFGHWDSQPMFPDEIYDPWTQMQWIRLNYFVKAGRQFGPRPGETYLPTPAVLTKDVPTGAVDDPPFSPVAMTGALILTGYKPVPCPPDDVRQLAEALIHSAKADLNGLFVAPETLLEHVERFTLTRSEEENDLPTPRSPGERAANSVKEAIFGHLDTLRTWCGVVEVLDRVDWNDEDLLLKIARDPTFAKKEDAVPLCDLMLQVDHHEAMSAIRLRRLFREWRRDSAAPSNTFPSWWTQDLRRAQPNMTPRDLQLQTLAGMSRFERATVRVCLPNNHPTVPPQISLLEFERLLLEKPSRASQLSNALMKAIGYHYTVVHIHCSLRTYIFDKARASPGWTNDFNYAAWPGKCPPEARPAKTPETPLTRILAVLSIGHRSQKTFRDDRMVWFAGRTSDLNWANYLVLDSTAPSSPRLRLDGAKLKNCLDVISNMIYVCELSGIMDAENAQNEGKEYRVKIRVDVVPDLGALILANTSRCQLEASHLTSCLFRPETVRQTRTETATSEILSAGHLGSAPLAQSGHAYLRDNPNDARPSPRVEAPAPDPQPVEEEEHPVTVRFRVNGAQLKLVERLFGKREGDVRWSKLLNLFKRIGFRAVGMGGSAYHIKPVTGDGKSILMYKPHPEPTLTSEKARAIGEQLVSTFGWSVSSFARDLAGSEDND